MFFQNQIKRTKVNPGIAIAALVSLVLSLGFVSPAQATTTVDVAKAPLHFDTAVFEVESAVLAGNVITFTTKHPHRLDIGTQFVSSGFSPSVFNLVEDISTVPSERTFTVPVNAADVSATTLGLVTVSNKAYTITNIATDGTNAVITTATNHGLRVGQEVSIRGASFSNMVFGSNLDFTDSSIVSVTANTFTFTAQKQGTYISGGEVRLSRSDLGVNMVVNDFVDYQAVYVSGSATVHARVTMVEQRDLEGRSGTPGQVDELDETRTGVPGQNSFLNTGLDFDTGLGDSYAQFQIEFYTGTPSNRTPVTLQNVAASVYDIDGLQYVELSGYTRYFRASNTELVVSATPRGTTRFAESNNSGFSGVDSFTKGRVTAEFDSVTVFTYRIGKTATIADTDSAFYQLDFSLGWDVGGAWTSVRAQAVNAPVYVAPAPAVSEPDPYTGPLPTSITTIPKATETEAIQLGERLHLITAASVNGKQLTLRPINSQSLGLVFPALPEGIYDVLFTDQGGATITHIGGLRVVAPTAAETVNPVTSFSAQRLFANYRGDRGPVVNRDRAAITSFIGQYKGITSVRCVGSTSGVPAKRTDPALARARATNACDIVKRLVPNATITIGTSTGKGVGQRFRSVTIFISGTN